ncbi:MAG: U32 family peptidase, partial [Pseudobutyrivibrio sp.]|nr:U32 family peptidase [Pseudobutyrivibrio sp.]
GCDAVYFGGDFFGARAFAKNFSVDDAKEAIKYGHLHGVKSYLTVNTLLKNTEIERKLYDYLKVYVENGIDAFIVQDFGVFDFIKTYFPDTDLHCSTQMTLCNNYGASFFEKRGASRIVTARELSLGEIRNIREECPDLEIEAFVHGALCVCYSGQCLMSSMIGGRSGNRGRCAQPCRLPYSDVKTSDGTVLKLPGEYILSPKDFNNILNLPQMAEAGVNSFKIEGRMKQLNYACGAVSIYRKYLDLYLSKGKEGYKVSDLDNRLLFDFGNRSGFSDLYLKEHNGKDLITFKEPSHKKSQENFVAPAEKKIGIKAKVEAHLNQSFQLTLYNQSYNVTVTEGDPIAPSSNKPATEEDIKKSLLQTGDTAFIIEESEILMDEGIFLPVSIIKKARRNALEQFESLLIDNSFKKTVISYDGIEDRAKVTNQYSLEPFVTVSTLQQFEAVREFNWVKRIGIPFELADIVLDLCPNVEIFLYLPAVFRRDKTENIRISEEFSGVIATSFDWLGYLDSIGYPKDKIICDYRLYTMSNRAIAAYEKNGYKINCVPLELSLKEIEHRNNENSQLIVYGRFPLMITANCSVKNSICCNKENTVYSFKDRKGKKLLAKCDCSNCINTIYNSDIYLAFDLADQLKNLGAIEFRLDFTLESKDETRSILKSYKSAFIDNIPFKSSEVYTKGHLKRGVE